MDCIWDKHESGVACINCGRVKAKPTRRNCSLKKGLGDTIAGVTKAIVLKPSGGCNKRRQKANNLMPTSAYKNARWITTSQLADDTLQMVKHIPPYVTGICGVPRSGMIPASILATHLNLPLYTLEGKEVLHCGHGRRFRDINNGMNRLLLVDDTVMLGTTSKKHRLPKPHLFGAVYKNPHANLVDIDVVGVELEPPHFLEWNFFNSKFVEKCAFDMDGILCEDQEPPHNKPCVPLHLPRNYTIPAIITARFEKDREITEVWLKKHGIKYNELVMGPWESESDRNKPEAISKYKAHEFKKRKLQWFVESCPIQSKEIAQLTGAWVICPPAGRIY